MLELPKLGMGTWKMGEDKSLFSEEKKALQKGLEEGIKLIDTAEMYGDGGAEILVGEAIEPFYRDDLFLVSKIYPQFAGKEHLEEHLLASLDRLQTKYLDLYLLHWKGEIPLEETIEEMERMKSKGLILHWGVSNFDTDDMNELFDKRNGSTCEVNQVLYHLGSRGTEFALREWMREHEVAMMAYCPLGKEGRHVVDTKDENLLNMAKKYNISVEQLLLAFVLYQDITAIPKAARMAHIEENIEMGDFKLEKEDFATLSRLYPAPLTREPLDVV